MDEHELLTRIQREIEPDLMPVRPLGAPGVRALWLPAIWLVLAGFVLTAFGFRADVEALGVSRSIGFSLIEAAVGFWLLALALRFSIPAMAGSSLTPIAWVAVALSVHVALGWATLERSALVPPPGHEWSAGLACAGVIAALSVAPLVVGTVLLRRGLVTEIVPACLLTGLASGLAAEATWRLHCEYSAWGHVLPFHTAALVLPLLAASAAAAFAVRWS